MAINLINRARQLWTTIRNERNKKANTAERVGNAGLALVDLIENVRSEIPEIPEISATLTVFTTDGQSYNFGLLDLAQQEPQEPQPYYAAFGIMIGTIL